MSSWVSIILVIMKKLIFLISIFIANVIYASFPVNNISNNLYNHSESAPDGSPVIWPIFILWLLPIVILFFKSTTTDDIKKKKKLSKIIRYLFFIPLALFVIILIFMFIALRDWEPIKFSLSN